MSRRAKRIVGIAIVVLVIIEVIPVWLLQRNPPITAEPNWDSAQTRFGAAGLFRLSQQRDSMAVVRSRSPCIVAGDL